MADGRERFLRTVRQALGRDQTATPPPKPGEANGESSIRNRVAQIQREAEDNADALMSQLHEAATKAGWNVARVASPAEAADHVLRVVQDLEARSIVRSAHDVLDTLALDEQMVSAGVGMTLAAIGDTVTEEQRQEQRASIRESCISADIGLTGVDHAIAETGSVVLLPRRGVSRLVSLLPPVHVAVVRRGEVLPGLDELFALQRLDHIEGALGSYLNIITGPSRSADIEYTLVTGVHGPGEVHMVLLG